MTAMAGVAVTSFFMNRSFRDVFEFEWWSNSRKCSNENAQHTDN
jgi:hypothetical protein